MARTVVERPAATLGPPRQRRLDLWIAMSAAVFVVAELLPWQRECIRHDISGVEVAGCFTVRGWQGNAALLGMLATLGALVLIGVVLRRRGGAGVGSRLVDWMVLSVFVTSAALKWLFTLGAVSTAGCWIGGLAVAVAVVAVGRTARVRWREGTVEPEDGAHQPDGPPVRAVRPGRLGTALAALVPAALILGAAIPYQATGLGRWGGPLAIGSFSESGGASAGVLAPVGRTVGANAATWIRNWDDVLDLGEAASTIAFPDGRHGIIVGLSTDRVLHSADAGATWRMIVPG